MQEPGLDLHDWRTRYADLEDRLAGEPRQGLAELGDLVAELLDEAGVAVDEPVADDGISPELAAEFRAARETQARAERGEDVDPGDVAAALAGLRAIFEHLTGTRASEQPEA